MKARVKATGDIIEISESCSYLYAENYDKPYNLNELEFLDVKEKSLPKDEPDYWEKLHHQAVIAAMQGLMSRAILDTPNSLSSHAIHCATTLVNRLKEEEKND